MVESGGNLVGIGSLTLDTGEGVDDLFVAFFERGQCVLYTGTDPGTANDWRHAGTFELGPLVGDRPLVKLGADLIAITTDGYIPILQFLQGGRQKTNLAISDTIAPTVTDAIQSNRDALGWEAVLFTPAKWLLFNVPVSTNVVEQHVMNTQTGAWCQFKGMNAKCWHVAGDDIFFGAGDGKVMKANSGGKDGEDPISSLARSAYNYLGSPYDKQFRLIRAYLESDAGQTQVSVGASTDFARANPMLGAATLSDIGSFWGEAVWDVAVWATGIDRSRVWTALNLQGSSISIHVACRTADEPLTWFSTEILYDQVTGAIAGSG